MEHSLTNTSLQALSNCFRIRAEPRLVTYDGIVNEEID